MFFLYICAVVLLGSYFPNDPSVLIAYTAAGTLVVYNIWDTWSKKRKNDHEKKYGNPEIMRQVIQKDKIIDALLIELREQTDSARILIYMFHNGDHYFSGSPVQRMTCAYESVAGGIASVLSDQKGLIASKFSGMLDLMFDSTPLLIDVEKLPESYSKVILDSLNILSFACAPLHQNDLIVGCLQVHWIRDLSSQNITGCKDKESWLRAKVLPIVSRIEFTLAERMSISGSVVVT